MSEQPKKIKNLKIDKDVHEVLKKYCDKRGLKMYKFLDDTLKRDGIKSLTDVVEVYNALASAVKLQEQEEVKSEVDEGRPDDQE